MSPESADTKPSLFSASYLEHREEALLAHLRFCSWCGCGMEAHRWPAHWVPETSFARCPECGALDPPRTIAELREIRARQALSDVFVCLVCGTPYRTSPRPDPPPDQMFPGDEARIREERIRRYTEPWTAHCETCGGPTQPVRATERDGIPAPTLTPRKR